MVRKREAVKEHDERLYGVSSNDGEILIKVDWRRDERQLNVSFITTTNSTPNHKRLS